MKISRIGLAAFAAASFSLLPARAFDRPEVTFKVFQFPPNMIPRIDGDPSDWDIVPDSYAVDGSQLLDDEGPRLPPDPKVCDVKVKVGWVKGMNRLYFLYEADQELLGFRLPRPAQRHLRGRRRRGRLRGPADRQGQEGVLDPRSRGGLRRGARRPDQRR